MLAGFLLAAGLAGAAAYGQPVLQTAGQPPKDALPPPDVKVDAKTGALIVPLGGMVRFAPALPKDAKIQDIQLNREDILTWKLDDRVPGVLLLTGRAPGLVQLRIMLVDRPPLVFDIIVQPDYELLRALIKRTVPTANVEVSPGLGNVVILSGYVTSPQDADIIVRLTQSQVGGTPGNVINAMQVGGVQQVQIDVVIASVDRNEIRSRGFDFAVNTRPVQFASVLSGLLSPPAGGTGGNGFATFSPDANLQLGLVPAQFFGALRALRTEGVAKFLGEPRVVTQTGRPAFFLAGGRQAVLGPDSGINGPGIQFEQVGTQMEVLPIVYGNNKIWLEINPQVRSVNQGLGITTVFGTTPGFTEQQARCAVMLESGQTFAIGGLIQNTIQASSARVPVLGDLPFVGTLFSRVNYDERESELVILVTPRLVDPLDCNQVPRRLPGRETRSPDDYELFLEGILEAPRGQRKVWNGRCYNAAYKCDPTVNAFPCIGNVCYGTNVGGGGCGAGGCGTGSCGTGGCAPAGRVIVGRPAPFPTPTMPPYQHPAAMNVPNQMPATAEPVVTPTSLPATIPVGLPAESSQPPIAAPLMPMAPSSPYESPDAPPK